MISLRVRSIAGSGIRFCANPCGWERNRLEMIWSHFFIWSDHGCLIARKATCEAHGDRVQKHRHLNGSSYMKTGQSADIPETV